jgi:hypothetical protein
MGKDGSLMTTENRALNLVGNLTIADVGRLCYNVDTVYGNAIAGGIETTSQGTAWDRTTPERREMVLASVRKILDTPTITPAQLHDDWIDRMKAQGWTRGATTNVPRKQHALLVPYPELAPGDQVKARLFITIVNSLMPSPVGDASKPGGLRTEE